MSVRRSAWLLAIVLVLPLGFARGQAETIQVVIDGLVFVPSTITTRRGDTIEWINKDPFDHTATVKGAWETMLPAGKTVSQHLDNAEAVDFYCRFHPNMKGRLIVAE